MFRGHGARSTVPGTEKNKIQHMTSGDRSMWEDMCL